MKELILNDGTQVSVNTRLSLWALKQAQDDGLISNDFVKNIISLGLGKMKEDLFDIDRIDTNDILNLAYVCYRNANHNGMDFDEFLKLMPLDLVQLIELYQDVLIGTTETKNSNGLTKSFKDATPKNRNKSKKKYRR